jgi:transcriptional regulator with XRE-family HTH domain
MSIHYRIKLARKANGLSLSNLAKKICISNNMIAKYEKHSIPSSDILIKLSQVLKVSMNYFMDDTVARIENILECKTKGFFRK